MSILSEKMKKARERSVPVGGFEFIVRRPTDMDMLEFSKRRSPADFVKFIVGWSGVKEIDLIPGGDGHPLEFDADACAEWLADRSDLFIPLVTEISDSYQKHKAEVEAAQKN